MGALRRSVGPLETPRAGAAGAHGRPPSADQRPPFGRRSALGVRAAERAADFAARRRRRAAPPGAARRRAILRVVRPTLSVRGTAAGPCRACGDRIARPSQACRPRETSVGRKDRPVRGRRATPRGLWGHRGGAVVGWRYGLAASARTFGGAQTLVAVGMGLLCLGAVTDRRGRGAASGRPEILDRIALERREGENQVDGSPQPEVREALGRRGGVGGRLEHVFAKLGQAADGTRVRPPRGRQSPR